MADQKIGRAVLELTIDDKQYKMALGQIQKDAEKTTNTVRGIGQAVNLSVFKEFASLASEALRAVGAGFLELVDRGALVAGVETAFGKLTGAIGVTKDEMLDTARGATKGLITDFDLMAAGNKALLLGLPVTSASFGTMAQTAAVLGRAMKQDATKSFDDLITALGRGSPLILDNLGITVKVGEANEAYARTLKKSAEALTEGEKKTAFYNAAMEAAAKKVAEIGEIQLTLADRVMIVRNLFTNFTDALGVAINKSPVLTAGLAEVGKALTTAFGKDKQANIEAVVRFVNDSAIAIVEMARLALQVAAFIGTSFKALQATMNGFFFALFGGVAGFTDFLRVASDAAAKLPGVGSAFKAVSSVLQGTKDKTDSLARGFGELYRDQSKAADGIWAGYTKVDTVLAGASAAMMRARDAAKTSSDGVVESTGAMAKGAAAAAQRTQEEAKKIADVYRTLSEEIFTATQVGLARRLVEIAFAEQRELDGVRNLKNVTVAEMNARLLLVQEKYRQLTAAAILAGDQIALKEQELQNRITVGQQTGIEARLTQLRFSHQQELAQLAVLTGGYNERYQQLAALLRVVYDQMTAAAQGHFSSVTAAAAAAGFQTQAELQKTADTAVRLYEQMKQSGLFNAQQLKEAWEKAEEAKRKAAGETKEYQLTSMQAIVEGTIQLFGVLGKKHKSLAIAGAIISTYQAIAKALASAPFPASLALAAGAAAAGWAQVNAIRNADEGFALGTPGLDFADFGPMSMQMLHNEEAVIPRGGGHVLAGEIADSMPEDGPSVAFLGRIAAGIESLPTEIRRGFRNALLLDVP